MRQPTIQELQARLARIMEDRPSHICAAHWLQIVEGADRVEVQSCACRERQMTIPEMRLIRQSSRRSEVWKDDEPTIPGADDARALAALRKRAMRPINRTI